MNLATPIAYPILSSKLVSKLVWYCIDTDSASMQGCSLDSAVCVRSFTFCRASSSGTCSIGCCSIIGFCVYEGCSIGSWPTGWYSIGGRSIGDNLPEGCSIGDNLPEGCSIGDNLPEGSSIGDNLPEGFFFKDNSLVVLFFVYRAQ